MKKHISLISPVCAMLLATSAVADEVEVRPIVVMDVEESFAVQYPEQVTEASMTIVSASNESKDRYADINAVRNGCYLDKDDLCVIEQTEQEIVLRQDMVELLSQGAQKFRSIKEETIKPWQLEMQERLHIGVEHAETDLKRLLRAEQQRDELKAASQDQDLSGEDRLVLSKMVIDVDNQRRVLEANLKTLTLQAQRKGQMAGLSNDMTVLAQQLELNAYRAQSSIGVLKAQQRNWIEAGEYTPIPMMALPEWLGPVVVVDPRPVSPTPPSFIDTVDSPFYWGDEDGASTDELMALFARIKANL